AEPTPTDSPAPDPAPSPTDEPAASPTDTSTPSDQPSDPTQSDTSSPTDTASPSDTSSPSSNVTPTETRTLLVRLVGGLSATDAADALAAGGGTEVSTIDALRLHIIEVPAATVADSIAAYQADPRVDSVDRDRSRDAEATPNDPAYPDQWALPQIGWDQAYGTTTSSGVATIAVLDTGVQSSDVPTGLGWSAFGSDPAVDPNGHGTWAGAIAAATPQHLGRVDRGCNARQRRGDRRRWVRRRRRHSGPGAVRGRHRSGLRHHRR